MLFLGLPYDTMMLSNHLNSMDWNEIFSSPSGIRTRVTRVIGCYTKLATELLIRWQLHYSPVNLFLESKFQNTFFTTIIMKQIVQHFIKYTY